MSNPFDQFDAPAAEGGNPFDQFDAPAAKKLPSKGILSDVGGAFVEGAKSAGRAIAGTANIYAGDESALVEKAQAQESAQAQKPAALTAFNQAVTERVKPLGDDPGLLDSVKAIGGAVVDQPKGAGLAVVEQLPNAAPAIAGGMAGMKAGAALGTAIMPGVGTTIGAIGGGLAGMFLGNTAIETGYKGIEAAQDGAVTQDEMSRVKKEGAVKAGVITGVDALTLGLSKAVTNIPARAVESATRNALTKAGVNVADEAAVLAARQSPEISAAVRAAQESAFASANTLGKRAAAGGAALGLETVGEGLGEYLGELAATGKANVADAVLEAMMSLGQSGAEVAWGAARNKKAEQGGMWDTAEAKFQPPPPTLVTEPEPLQQRIDALMGIDTGAMSDKERTQYEKDLTAAFLEPVGVTQDEHGLEIPFTMADYLNAQVRAEDSVRARPLKQNAADQSGNRLQQLADEETQQQPDIPGYVAPEIPVVGTLSAMANMAIQSGAHKQSQMQQAMQAAVEKQKSTSEGSPRAAQPEQMATQAPQANDAQTPAFDVSTRTEGQLSYLAQNGQPGWKEAATAELVRLNGSISESVPALNAGNSVNLPATSISSLQDQLDKTEPFSEQSQLLTERLQLAVTDDAKSAIGAGEMPVYKVTDHVSVAIHPSAQKEGMIQVTRYTKDGVIGDSQYNSIDEAVRFEGLTHKPRIPSNEAIAHIENSIAAEAEYQKRKNEQQAGAGLPASTAGGSRPAPVANQEPVKNQSEQPLDMVPAADAVSQPKTDAAPEAKQDNAPVSTLQPDPALQNRDRGRAASVNQMQSIARNPDYMRLGPSRTPDSGAPMVFAVGGDTNKIAPSSFGANDIAVMSDGQRVPFRYAVVDASSVEPSNFADGATNPAFASNAPGTIKALNNGRTAGVRAAHEGSKAANYTAELLADQAHGVSPEAIRNTPNPMLVRVYAEQANTGDMAAKSQGQGLGMSASERATQDAELMTADVLDKFAPGDIASAGNRDFVRSFVGKLAANDVADMMDATGNLSQDGRRRIEAALLTAAYGKSDLVQELFESTDTDIKAIGNALKVMSGQWAAMRNAAKEGSIDPATDMTANLVEAVNIVRRSRAEGSSIAELAGQGDLMGGNYLNELSELFLRIFYKGKNYDRARGGDKVIAALQEVVTSAMNTKAEAGLFGDSFKATPKQIVESARSKIDEENKPASQSSLFGANGQATAVSQGNRGEGAAQSGEVGSRPVGTGSSQETGKQAEPVDKAAEQSPAVDSKQSNDADLESRILIAADSIDKLRKVDVERVLMQGNIDRKQMADYIKRKRPEFSAEVDSVIEDATVEDNQKSEALDREMAGFTGVNDAEYELRQLSRKEKRDGDIELGNGKFVTLEQAVEAAKKSMDRADWSKPFQFNRILDIAPIDWNTMVGAMNTATVDAKKQEEAKPVALLSIAGREKFDPISLDTAAGVVARMRQTIKEVWKVDLRLVPTFSALPQEVKDAIAKYGEGTRAKGVLHKGSVYIVADEHASDADVETTILHEIKGHVGLRRLYSDAINKDLGALYMSIGGRRGLADLAKARGFTDELQGYAESLSNSDFTDEERTRIVMEELLSHIAQDPKFGDKVKAIVGKIRAWLRDNGFMALAKFGEADLLNILAKASKALETVRDDNGPVVLMTAWHGSPHDHNKFDSSKIGTGEGAQAYGHGLYFAGERSVAEYYRNAGSSAARLALDALNRSGGIAKEAIKELKKWDGGRNQSDFLDAISLLKTGNQNGRLYQVELAPSENEYLDWDKPLSEQSDTVKAALDKVGLPKKYHSENKTGSEIYRLLSQDSASHITGKSTDEMGDKAASGFLHSIGIRGIRYLDGLSRNRPLKEIKAEFLAELPEDAEFDEVMDLVGTGRFSPKNEALIKALAADEWLGFDYPAQAISTALGNGLSNYDASPELMKAVSSAKDGGTHNFVIFNDADVSITAKYNIASKDKLTPADKAIYGMAAEGKSAAEVLKFIASASRSPFNRQVAKLLLKTGIAPSVTVGDGKGWKMNAGEGNKYAAGYNPKTDTISLFRPASSERNMLHELIHAATLKALSKKGMASAQMNALYQHVKKSGKLKGMYGMSDVDEFIAEAFSNPKFQAALKQVAAPSTSTAKSAWHWFVRVIKGILGLPSGSENALSQALEIGIGVMRENMRLNEGAGDVRYNAAPGKINQTDTEAFRKWFGDSRVVDADGKPMRVYHGTGATDIGAFNVSDRGSYGGGIYLTPEIRGANDYAIYRGAPSSTVYPVYAAIKNPASGSEAAQVASWKGEENAREELIRRGFDGVVDMRSGEIVAFYPEQIKSAIGNNGDFDGSNPDIRYNAAPGKINQTDTEAFKRWFGDSAVVDSDGKPLRVFHGTASDITAFDIGRSGESTGNTGFYGAGAYFSEDADYASGFSFWARRSDDQAPNVVPVYLSLKNPAYINITPRSQAASEKSRATAEKIISTMIARGTDKAVVDKLQGFVSENKFEPFMGTLYNALGGGTGTTALLKEAGFDGVTIYGGISGKEKLAEAVAFDPTQIKSAIGNSGDFDATNPDIRYNVADEGGDIGRIVGDSVSDQLKAAVLRLSGRPMLDHTDPFAAENARLREQDQSLWSKAKKQLRRYLAPGGLLPQSVFAEKIKRDSEFQAVEFDVRHLIGGLEQAVKADFGIAFDKLSKEQMRPITEALAGKVPASLPEATKTAAVAMRQYIDGMSTEYLKIIQQKIDAKMLKALESGKDSDKAQAINEIELFEKIKGNIGRYVHRSYQAFDDPKWFEKVPAHVLNASRLYLKQGYMEAGENDAKASQMAEVTLHEILKNGTAYDSMESFIAESKLGAKDLSVLMRRKEVPAQIRALLGEYPDARLNFTKSATKMGRLIWNTRFLDRVRDMGMGSFFFEGKDRPPNATTQIAADGSEVYAPLNGLWTFPEIAQSFKDALGKEQMSDLYRAIVRFNGLVKYGKTVLAPTTAMRNWQSAMFFSLANGHFDLTQMKKSISAFREQVSQKATGQDLKYLRHLKQLGVVYDTPYAGEMARLMEDARMEELLSSDKGDAVRWFRKANQLAQGFYTFGDDFWKIIGFENEKAGLMKAGLSLQEAETEAAKRIRDTYPTYSMVGRGVQWLSRFPLAGTFVSFPAEIIRTSGNMLRTVAADLKSDNPKLRELGMKRAAGMVFVSAAFYSLAALSMAMAGVGDDEDEAIRDLAPEWQKNSTFLYLGRDEKGNLRYFDMSFLDPYGYWKRPITAMLRNQPWEDSLASGLRGMLEPFIGADIAAKAIFEAVANQKENGGKVYKEKDGAINQTIDVADHLRKALQPGVVGNVERLVKAAGDVRKSSGQPYSMEDELVALVGWRATTIDPKTALYYRSFEFTDAVAEARKTITETLRDANEITPEDIADAKARAQAKQEQAFKEMHRLVSAAESAGMSKMQIVQTLRLSNISQANIGSLMRGETPDVSITPQLAARAVRQASQMRGPEYAAEVFDRYRQARAN